MKLKIRELVESEVEITLPAFRKSNCHYYKVITEDLTICVTDLMDGHYSISQSRSGLAFSKDNVDCTEEEYNLAFGRVLKQLAK